LLFTDSFFVVIFIELVPCAVVDYSLTRLELMCTDLKLYLSLPYSI